MDCPVGDLILFLIAWTLRGQVFRGLLDAQHVARHITKLVPCSLRAAREYALTCFSPRRLLHGSHIARSEFP